MSFIKTSPPPAVVWPMPNGRVEFFPSAEGMVRLTALTADGRWLAEFMVRSDLFNGGVDIPFLEDLIARAKPQLRVVQGRKLAN